MKHISWSWLQVMGANKRELGISIKVAIIGFVIVSLVFFPRRFAFDDHAPIRNQMNAARNAGYFVVAVIALILALNAYRDKDNTDDGRGRIFLWCSALGVWMLTSLVGFFSWWETIDPVTKPSWFPF